MSLTTKGSKDLAGGKRLHLLVAIAHRKGVIGAEPYVKMDGPYFARFICHHFPILFDITTTNGNANLNFVMDNDPSQTSAIARKALNNIGAEMQVIPARSPDLNPIENLFHIVRKKMEAEILEKNITHQSWDEFVDRVKFNIWSVSREYVDKTIGSMSRRIKDIAKWENGQNTSVDCILVILDSLSCSVY